jgi:hypothetical protein
MKEGQANKDKEGQRGKKCSGGCSRKIKRGSNSISLKKGMVGSYVVVPLGKLIKNLFSRFWAQWGI